MAQLATPQGIGKTIPSNDTDTTVTLTWNKGTYDLTKVQFAYQFVNKGDGSQIVTPTVKTAAAASGSNITAVLEFDSNAQAKEMADYVAEVQAQPIEGQSTDTASAWGRERYWIIGPTLTITIGGNSYTLSKDTFAGAGSKIYKLPVSQDNPATITYDNIKSFAKDMGLTAPSEYPNGTAISGTLNIYELVVDVGNALFSLSISVDLPKDAPWNVIPGLTIDRVGLALKRTDGTL